MRITGLNTGLDTDEIVRASMLTYQNRIDVAKQKKEILSIKQTLYRDVMTDMKNLYNKYFDVANKNNLLSTSNIKSISFSSSDSGVATAKDTSGARAESYDISVTKLAKAPTMTLKKEDYESSDTIEIKYGDKVKRIYIGDLDSEEKIAQRINSTLSSSGINAKYSQFEKGIVLTSKTTGDTLTNGTDNMFTVTIGNAGDSSESLADAKTLSSSVGENAEAVIINSNGNRIEYTGDNALKSNKLVVDGMEVTLNGIGETKLTGTVDVSELQDKITDFINEYNDLIVKLNTLTTEERDRNYQPLTSDQKEAMTEDEIKLWEAKVKKGQLRNDMYLTNIASSLRTAMTSMVEGAGISLESIGISPVKDYTEKSGTFKIDQDKLKDALENNFDQVKSLFIDNVSNTDGSLSSTQVFNQKGVFNRLKDIIYDNAISSKGTLMTKAGYEGTSSVSTNEISRQIAQYNKKITNLESVYTQRENALYIRYARLESSISKYTSQQQYLSSMFG